MVSLHQHTPPRAVVVKRGRRRSCDLTRRPDCLWPGCNARLAHDHDSPICGCHVSGAYRLAHDRRGPVLVLHLLMAAYPAAVDLCAVLRATSHEVEDRVAYLRRRGHEIVGAQRGYAYALPEVADRVRRGRR